MPGGQYSHDHHRHPPCQPNTRPRRSSRRLRLANSAADPDVAPPTRDMGSRRSTRPATNGDTQRTGAFRHPQCPLRPPLTHSTHVATHRWGRTRQRDSTGRRRTLPTAVRDHRRTATCRRAVLRPQSARRAHTSQSVVLCRKRMTRQRSPSKSRIPTRSNPSVRRTRSLEDCRPEDRSRQRLHHADRRCGAAPFASRWYPVRVPSPGDPIQMSIDHVPGAASPQ